MGLPRFSTGSAIPRSGGHRTGLGQWESFGFHLANGRGTRRAMTRTTSCRSDATLDAHEENLWPTPVSRWQFAGVGNYEQDVSDEAAFQESARSWTSGSVWRVGKYQGPVSECKRVPKRVSLWVTPSSRPRTDKWACEPLVETILWVHCLITCPRQCAFADCLRFHLLIASQTPLARISAFQPHGGVWQLRYRARPSGARR
jgi:hypothetical protein